MALVSARFSGLIGSELHGCYHTRLKCCRRLSGLHWTFARFSPDVRRSGARLVSNAKKKTKDYENREEEWNKAGKKYEPPEWDYNSYQALLHGGEEVVNVMETMTKVLGEVTRLDEKSYETGLMLAAFACVGQRLEHLDGSFLMALDMMIERADREKDDKSKKILDIIKETTIAQVSNKSAPLLQIVSMMCHAPEKEHRREILRAAAAGGKALPATGGGTYTVPGGNILEVAKQANDFITDMEEKPKIPDRQLLAKLVLVREEAHDLLGGGFLDERNKPAFANLPEAEVDFISKLVAVRPGPHIREKLENVLHGFDEGADELAEREKNASEEDQKKVKEVGPVRPGMLTECLAKLINGMYNNKTAVGFTVQHLDWTYKNTLEILQGMAHGKPDIKVENTGSSTEQQQQQKGKNERYQGIWNEQEKVYRERKLSEMEIKKEREQWVAAEQKKNMELEKQEKQRVRNIKKELLLKMQQEEKQMSKPEDWGELLQQPKAEPEPEPERVQPRRRSQLRSKS